VDISSGFSEKEIKVKKEASLWETLTSYDHPLNIAG
jgi:hypothetical protein